MQKLRPQADLRSANTPNALRLPAHTQSCRLGCHCHLLVHKRREVHAGFRQGPVLHGGVRLRIAVKGLRVSVVRHA